MLNVKDIGEKRFKSFVVNRLLVNADPSNDESFYASIKRSNLDTGLKKIKKQMQITDTIKKDRQAFGSLIIGSISIKDALNYPLTSYPLNISRPDGTLRQTSTK